MPTVIWVRDASSVCVCVCVCVCVYIYIYMYIGYDMPTVIWVRDASKLEDKYSYEKVYKEVCAAVP